MSQKTDWAKKTGQILKRLIKQSPYRTQTNFADAANVDPTTVRRWIAHGIRNITLIEEVANLFGMNAKEFLSQE